MDSKKIIITSTQMDYLISQGVRDFFHLGLKFLNWKLPFQMELVDKKKYMLAKIKYGI